ncbi:MAG: hypothetical protein HY905_07225 [Deltaproteobacteria bacterium]|nr:hypothetical protein [Deltaproteobacteria bacterium]
MEADTQPDADGDADVEVEVGSDAGADADADVVTDADAVVGPPARVWGELTVTGAIPAAGCVARGAGVCLRSDSVDPAAEEMSGGGFRARGIVVVGGGR